MSRSAQHASVVGPRASTWHDGTVIAAPRARVRDRLTVPAAVAAGGALGASARYLVLNASVERTPLAVLLVNVLGCFLMGVLVAATEDGSAPPLVRPFLGTGVLGGFTTVSTYAVTTWVLAGADVLVALTYLVLTPLLAVPAAGVGAWLMRTVRPVR